MTGLNVLEVNVHVQGVNTDTAKIEQEEKDEAESEQTEKQEENK